MSYEFIQETAPTGEIFHKVKYKDRKTGKTLIYRTILDKPIDSPLCEIIEEFGIPIIRIPGIQYKIRYIAKKAINNVLSFYPSKLNYAEKNIVFIHPRESILKQDYNAQVGMRTEFSFKKGGKPLTLYSLGDALQILAILQNDKERGKLIRKLIIKLEELQEKLNKQQSREILRLGEILNELDDVAYEWIKEHQEDNIYIKGYKRLWGNKIWYIIILIKYEIREILGLPNPPRKYAGLHHNLRPYSRVYPHTATTGRIIDNRYDHEDPRQKRFY